jgi:hypothetical protein
MPDRSKYDLSEGGLMPWWYHMHIEVVEVVVEVV